MAILTLAGGIPPFKRALFSFWFKVSASALAACRASYLPDTFPAPQMNGILPLIMFGPFDLLRMDHHNGPLDVFWGPDQIIHNHGFRYTDNTWQDLANSSAPQGPFSLIDGVYDRFHQLLDPGYIGIDCTSDSGNKLRFRFPWAQSVLATGEWAGDLSFQVVGMDYPSITDHWNTFTTFPPPTPPGSGPFSTELNTRHLQDLSDLNVQLKTVAFEGGGPLVAADRWHHVLILPDFTVEVSVEGQAGDYSGSPPFGTYGPVISTSKMFFAFDKVNKTNAALSNYAASRFGGGGPNDVLTPMASQVNGQITDQSGFAPPPFLTAQYVELTNAYTPIPSTPRYNFSPPDFETLAIYIPGSNDFGLGAIMAELQVFTDVSADTSDPDVIALFVDSSGKYVPVGPAAAAFGKRPDIELASVVNWQTGNNTGTAGPFDEVGTITEYQHNPGLG